MKISSQNIFLAILTLTYNLAAQTRAESDMRTHTVRTRAGPWSMSGAWSNVLIAGCSVVAIFNHFCNVFDFQSLEASIAQASLPRENLSWKDQGRKLKSGTFLEIAVQTIRTSRERKQEAT